MDSNTKDYRMSVWKTPTKVVFLDGDHTWVTGSDISCWRALGGDPGHYCNPNRWKFNPDTNDYDYLPPEGNLLRTGKGDTAKAALMAGSEDNLILTIGGKLTDTGITMFHAGIAYGLNGVCHQIANRILLPSKMTVDGASGYNSSWWCYDVYGTYYRYASKAAFVTYLSEVVFKKFPSEGRMSIYAQIFGYSEIFVADLRGAFNKRCDKAGIIPPSSVENDLISQLLRLNDKYSPPSSSRESAILHHDLHIEEVEIMLNHLNSKMKHPISESNIRSIRDVIDEHFRPTDEDFAFSEALSNAVNTNDYQEIDSLISITEYGWDAEKAAAYINAPLITIQNKIEKILSPKDYKALFNDNSTSDTP